jgi:hypothetical protein
MAPSELNPALALVSATSEMFDDAAIPRRPRAMRPARINGYLEPFFGANRAASPSQTNNPAPDKPDPETMIKTYKGSSTPSWLVSAPGWF